MKPHAPSPRLTAVLTVAVLLLSLLLRLRGLDTTGLWGDQAFTLNTAMRWVNVGPVPLAANKSSVGFVNPPMIEYLYAIALFLWRDVLSVSLLTLLGGLVAVAFTGYMTARLFGRRAGLWAMLAFAVAPWAVFWSQLIWNQTMVPPFAALALGLLLLYLFDRPRAAYLIGSFASAAAMTQVHPGSAVQLLTIALTLLLYRRRARWGHVAAGAAVFALLYLPYLLYQFGTGWADLAAMRAVAGQAATWSSAAVLLSLDLLRAQGLYRAVPAVEAADALAAALFLGGLAVVVWRVAGGAWRVAGDDRRPPTAASGPLLVILLWLSLPLLFYLRSGVYLQNYYLVGQWPTQFMILGIALDALQRMTERRAARAPGRQRAWRAAVWLLPLPFVALFTYQVFFSLRYQDARAAGDGPPLQVRHARALIADANRLLAARPDCALAGLGRGAQVETSDLALLVEFTAPARVLLADADLALPQPSPCAVTLDSRPGTPASYALAAQADPIPGAAVTVKDGTWQFYDWSAPLPAEIAAAPRWDAGLALVGAFGGEPIPGQDMTQVLTWEVVGEPPAVYHFGVYVLDETGAVAAQHDGPGFDSAQWRVGDRFVTFHPLPLPANLPPGRYRTAVALYTWPDVVRAPLVSGETTGYLGEFVIPAP